MPLYFGGGLWGSPYLEGWGWVLGCPLPRVCGGIQAVLEGQKCVLEEGDTPLLLGLPLLEHHLHLLHVARAGPGQLSQDMLIALALLGEAQAGEYWEWGGRGRGCLGGLGQTNLRGRAGGSWQVRRHPGEGLWWREVSMGRGC